MPTELYNELMEDPTGAYLDKMDNTIMEENTSHMKDKLGRLIQANKNVKANSVINGDTASVPTTHTFKTSYKYKNSESHTDVTRGIYCMVYNILLYHFYYPSYHSFIILIL